MNKNEYLDKHAIKTAGTYYEFLYKYTNYTNWTTNMLIYFIKYDVDYNRYPGTKSLAKTSLKRLLPLYRVLND